TSGRTDIILTAVPGAGGTFEWYLPGMGGNRISASSSVSFPVNKTDDLTIIAKDNSGYALQFWEDSSLGASRNVGPHTADAASYTAYFLSNTAADRITVTLNAYPAQGGTLTWSLPGMTTLNQYSVPFRVNKSDILTIFAKENAGYDFSFWEDASEWDERNVGPHTADTVTYTAYFLSNTAADKATITLTADPLGGGTFTWSLPGMTAEVKYSVPFDVNKTDDLTVITQAASGYVFRFWDGASTSTTRNVGPHTVDAVTYTAYFLAPTGIVNLTLKAYPDLPALSGAFAYSIDGTTWIPYTGPVPFNAGEILWIDPNYSSGYTFQFWENAADDDPRTYTINANVTLTAYFLSDTAADRVTITLAAEPGAGGTFAWSLQGMTAPNAYDAADKILINKTDELTIIAKANNGYTFKYWEDASAGTTRNVGTHTADETYSAYFLRTSGTVILTLNANPAASGTFRYNIQGFTAINYAGQVAFNPGDIVEIETVSVSGYTFKFWEDTSVSVSRIYTINASATLTAYFLSDHSNDTVEITLASYPNLTGTFTWSLKGMTAPVAYSPADRIVINKTDDLTVNAKANAGYTFRFWENSSGSEERHAGTHTVKTVTYTAYFLSNTSADKATITLEAYPVQGGTFAWSLPGMTAPVAYSAVGKIEINTTDELTVIAKQASGYTFKYWEDGSAGATRNIGTHTVDTTHYAYFLTDNTSDRTKITLTAVPGAGGTFIWSMPGMGNGMVSQVYTEPFFVNKSDVLTLTAVPKPSEYTFNFWDDATTNTSRSVGPHIGSAAVYTAYFLSGNAADRVTVTLDAYPASAGNFTWFLEGMTAQFTYSVTDRIVINRADDLTVIAKTNAGYTFRFWEDASVLEKRNVGTHTVNTVTYTAYFLTETLGNRVTVTLEAHPVQGGTFAWSLPGMTAPIAYSAADKIKINTTDDLTVIARQTSGYTFRYWEDGSAGATRNVGTQSVDETYSAYFLRTSGTATLTLNAYPAASGTFRYNIQGFTAINYTGPVAFNPGDILEIETTAASVYAFRFWEDTTDDNPRTYTINASVTLRAYFLSGNAADKATITLEAYPAQGGTVAWSLPGLTAPVAYSAADRIVINKTDDLTVIAKANPGYNFRFWDNASANTSRNVGPQGTNGTYTAYFLSNAPEERVTITIAANPTHGGMFTWSLYGMTGYVQYNAPFIVNKTDDLTITARAASGYIFRFWEDDSTALSRNVGPQTANATYSAYFINLAGAAYLTLESNPASTGTFEYHVPGFSWTAYVPGTPAPFNPGDSVEIRTSAVPGYTFRFWEDASPDASRTYTIHTDAVMTAYFLSQDTQNDTVEITLTADPPGGGAFTWKLEGMTDSVQYAGPFRVNTADDLTVITKEASGRTFLQWEDGSASIERHLGAQADDAEYTASFSSMDTEAVSYHIRVTAGTGTTAYPEGVSLVPRGSNFTVSFSALQGYYLSRVIVDGKDLSHEEIVLGQYTFRYVLANHTIEIAGVKTPSTETQHTLKVTLKEGDGYAEYSINGSGFLRYVSAVTVPSNADLTVMAYSADGYEFKEWREGSKVYKTQDVSFPDLMRDVNLELYFTDGTSADGGFGIGFWIMVVALIVLLSALLFWFFAFFRRTYEVIKVTGNVIGKDRAHRKRAYNFEAEGTGTVSYKVGEDGRWKTLMPNADGSYTIPRGDVVDKLTIEVR
ncbi:MAG: hypothetical protein LBH88_01180, partial [Candidatus Methanoplasma sp.]|nr:hypothetical protein [Candidatus Methanoplasma sp.]